MEAFVEASVKASVEASVEVTSAASSATSTEASVEASVDATSMEAFAKRGSFPGIFFPWKLPDFFIHGSLEPYFPWKLSRELPPLP